MSIVQTKRDVTIDDVRRVLSNELGDRYRVEVATTSTLKVGKRGVIPAKVTMNRRGDTTTFKITTTGLIISRVVQATSINPRVKKALSDAYPDVPSVEPNGAKGP